MVLAEVLELIEVEVVVQPQEQQEEGDNMIATELLKELKEGVEK